MSNEIWSAKGREYEKWYFVANPINPNRQKKPKGFISLSNQQEFIKLKIDTWGSDYQECRSRAKRLFHKLNIVLLTEGYIEAPKKIGSTKSSHRPKKFIEVD